ncbi:hypothetical protein [Luteipulveratus halotolerans]|uniref:hypothetical protein n=1 Tax=Luteipulveratus halotolerans TaxID=1631356 RepID=UPI0012FB20E0|nr:hypothetical protein [Luteipulveratus halotolerans]
MDEEVDPAVMDVAVWLSHANLLPCWQIGDFEGELLNAHAEVVDDVHDTANVNHAL